MRFGSHEVLRGIDLLVPAGRVLGYLGPNGAGKSTTVKILIGMLSGFHGSVTVCGFDVVIVHAPHLLGCVRARNAGNPGHAMFLLYPLHVGARREVTARELTQVSAEVRGRLRFAPLIGTIGSSTAPCRNEFADTST